MIEGISILYFILIGFVLPLIIGALSTGIYETKGRKKNNAPLPASKPPNQIERQTAESREMSQIDKRHAEIAQLLEQFRQKGLSCLHGKADLYDGLRGEYLVLSEKVRSAASPDYKRSNLGLMDLSDPQWNGTTLQFNGPGHQKKWKATYSRMVEISDELLYKELPTTTKTVNYDKYVELAHCIRHLEEREDKLFALQEQAVQQIKALKAEEAVAPTKANYRSLRHTSFKQQGLESSEHKKLAAEKREAAKGFSNLYKTLDTPATETEQTDDVQGKSEPVPKGTHIVTASRSNVAALYEQTVAAHDRLNDEWTAAEVDIDMILDYPALYDLGEKPTFQFHSAMLTAADKREILDKNDLAQVESYSTAVNTMKLSWKAAVAHAKRLALSKFSAEERETIRKVQGLLQHALSPANSAEARATYYKKARDMLGHLIELPEPAATAIETPIRLALNAPKAESANNGVFTETVLDYSNVETPVHVR